MPNELPDLPPIPDPLPPVPEPIDLPIELLLHGISQRWDAPLEEVARMENGVTIRPQELPLLYRSEGRGLREPIITTDTGVESTQIRIECASNHEYWLELQIPTATLVELIERAAAQHPLVAPALLSNLYTIRELFKVK